MNRKVFAAFALALAASQAPAAADPLPLAELCKQVFCRAPFVRLRVDAEHVFEQRIESPVPVLLPNGWVSVYPGETVYLEVQREAGALKLLRAVPKPEKPETTLTLKFEQLADKADVMLTVTNPLSVDVRFSMGFMALDSDRIRATSSCPVRAGTSLYEGWPHPIFQLILSEPQVLAAGDDHSCR
jgi:hypothetical protein